MKPDSRPVKLYWDISSVAALLLPTTVIWPLVWVDMPELIASGHPTNGLQGAEMFILWNEVAGKLKLVNENHDLIVQGNRMGICFDKKQINFFSILDGDI